MSPDPPREDSGDDDDRIRRFSGEFIEGVMDEEFFIVPDAPYELDMDVESDYTDSEEEEHRGAGGGASSSGRMSGRTATSVNINLEGVSSSEQEFSFQGQGRGRYRLLIPFPTPTTSNASDAAVSSTENSETRPETTSEISSINQTSTSQRAEGDCDQSPDANQLSPVTAEEIKPPSTENEGSKDEDSSKREIEMSEEKVETIKQVMKNITLPSAAIPKWASELDEDIWKRKLYDSLGNKSSPKPSSSGHHKQEETKVEGGSNSSNNS